MRFRDRPIEQKIFLIILPLCLVPAFFFLALVVVGMRVTFERAMGGELRRGALNLAESYDRFLNQHTATIRSHLYAANDNITSLAQRLARESLCDVLIEVSGTTTALQTDIRFLDPDASKVGLAALADASQLADWFKLRPGLSAEGVLADRLIARPGFLEGQRFLYYVVPGSGDRLWIMIENVPRLMQRYQRSLDQPPEVYFVYGPDLGLVLETRLLPDALHDTVRRQLRSGRFINEYFPVRAIGRDYLFASAESQFMKRTPAGHPNIGGTYLFLLQYDMETFLGPQDSLIWLSVIVSLLLVLFLLGVAVITARWMVRPLHELRAQAESFAGGNLEIRALVSSRDEIGEVAEAFNLMASRLRKSYAALEDRLEENRLHVEHIHVLNQVTSAVIQALSLERIFELLCDDLNKIFEFDAVWIALLDRDNQDLSITQIRPAGMITLFDRGRIPFHRSLHGKVITQRETIHAEFSPQHREEFFEMRIFDAEGLQSFLIAPLPGRAGIIGTLSIASSQPDAFSPDLATIMSSLANAVAVGIEQTELFQQISQMASELERKVAERTEELRRATQKLIQTEKYFATGRMAGNLGHEINNPLGIIKNYLHLVKTQLTRSAGGRRRTDPNLEHIDIIDEEVNRIARLVRQLMDLHRPVEHKVQPVDINSTLENLLSLMRDTLERMHIKVVCDFDTQLPWPVAAPDLIRQVLINLLRNAQDAMEGRGGTLSVRTSSISLWDDGQETQFVRIRISDTGIGIHPEHVSQIFDPFFTTKPSEKGSGLGLCVSYGIVRMYRGTIEVESQVDVGTTMIVTLPLVERDPASPTLSLDPTADPTI